MTGRAPQEGQGVGAEDPRASSAESLPGCHARPERGRIGVHERGLRLPRGTAPRCRARRSRHRGPARAGPRPGPRMLKSASRTRSAVGRVPARRGAVRRRPRCSPATTLTIAPSGGDRLDLERAEAPVERPPQHRVLFARASPGSSPSSSIDHARASSSSSESSGSRATRNSGRPCWRVPNTSPSPRSVRSTSASLKPSRSAATASQPAPRQLGVRVGEEQAVRLVLPAPDPPAQLVQLRDAVAVGLLDHDHRGVRDVDADLDHAGRHEHVDLARREAPHHVALLARGHLAVHHLDA